MQSGNWKYVLSDVDGKIGATENDAGPARRLQGRPYKAPRLLVYGLMKELTAGGSGGQLEGRRRRRRCRGQPFRSCRT